MPPHRRNSHLSDKKFDDMMEDLRCPPMRTEDINEIVRISPFCDPLTKTLMVKPRIVITPRDKQVGLSRDEESFGEDERHSSLPNRALHHSLQDWPNIVFCLTSRFGAILPILEDQVNREERSQILLCAEEKLLTVLTQVVGLIKCCRVIEGFDGRYGVKICYDVPRFVIPTDFEDIINASDYTHQPQIIVNEGTGQTYGAKSLDTWFKQSKRAPGSNLDMQGTIRRVPNRNLSFVMLLCREAETISSTLDTLLKHSESTSCLETVMNAVVSTASVLQRCIHAVYVPSSSSQPICTRTIPSVIASSMVYVAALITSLLHAKKTHPTNNARLLSIVLNVTLEPQNVEFPLTLPAILRVASAQLSLLVTRMLETSPSVSLLHEGTKQVSYILHVVAVVLTVMTEAKRTQRVPLTEEDTTTIRTVNELFVTGNASLQESLRIENISSSQENRMLFRNHTVTAIENIVSVITRLSTLHPGTTMNPDMLRLLDTASSFAASSSIIFNTLSGQTTGIKQTPAVEEDHVIVDVYRRMIEANFHYLLHISNRLVVMLTSISHRIHPTVPLSSISLTCIETLAETLSNGLIPTIGSIGSEIKVVALLPRLLARKSVKHDALRKKVIEKFARIPIFICGELVRDPTK